MNYNGTLHFTLLTKAFRRTPQTRFVYFLISDIFLIALATYLSFFLRFDFTFPPQFWPRLPYYIGITLLVVIPIFYFKRLYHFTWIYVGINDLIAVAKAVSYGFFLLGLILFLTRNYPLSKFLPRSVILIDFVLVFLFTGGVRFSKRLYSELLGNSQSVNQDKPGILIIGAGDAAEQLIRSIKQTPDYPFHLEGLLDDSPLKRGTRIHGTPVLGKIKDLVRIQAERRIRGIIIAIPSANPLQIKQIVEKAHSAGIQSIKTLPSLAEFMESRLSVKDIRDIDVEDLLGRAAIEISFEEIAQLIKGKTVLITGAAGSIGFELVRQVTKLRPQSLVCLDNDETGIYHVRNFLKDHGIPATNHCMVTTILHKEKINALFKKYRPDIVFHAAAYKHVDLMEQEPDSAILNNILGTWHVADAAVQSGVHKFVQISTDKAVNPTSIMGMTKRAAEMLIMHFTGDTQFIAVRFGNVLGSRGSVVPRFQEQIRSGGPITITHPDMKRYFMIPAEAILLVLQAAALGTGGELFVLDMGKPVKILDLAHTMIRLAGLEPNKDIPVVYTKPIKGEKLFEEILTNKEHMDATKNKSIFIAPNTTSKNKKVFFKDLESLIDAAKKGDQEAVRKQLAKLVE